jgi:urease accessory protein
MPSSPGSDANCSSSPEPSRASARTGRDGLLRLAFESRDGRTILRERRFTLPLQVLEPMDLEGNGTATLMLLNPTGGLLGGDRLETRIRLGPDARVCCSTPSATRVYRSPGTPAVQRTALEIGQGGVLEWMPDHLIPSPGARLRQSTEIVLAADATLLYLDAWAVGRMARSEAWGFDLLDSATVIRDERGLLLRERSILTGSPPADELGATEGFGYVATFVAAQPARGDWTDLVAMLHREVAGAGSGTRAGVSSLGRGGVIVRLLCASAPALRASVDRVWSRCRRALLRQAPPNLRKL